MQWQSSIYLNVLLIFIIISLSATFYAFKYKRKSYNKYGILLLLFLVEWMVCDYLRFSSSLYYLKILFLKLSYIGIASVPVIGFLFALSFTNQKKYIKPRNILILSIVPFLTVVLAFTNEYHNLFWKNIYIDNLESFIMTQNYGIIFWIFLLYLATFSIIGVVLISKNIFEKKYFYKSQGILIIIVVVLPLFLSLFDIFDVKPFNTINITSLSLTTGIVASIFALDKTRKSMIIPIAIDKVLKSLKDGVIIIDTNNRMIDINSSAEKIFNINGIDMIGKDVKILFPDLDFKKLFKKDFFGSPKEFSRDIRNHTYHYDFSVSNITDIQSYSIGKAIVIRDITQRVRSEEKIKYLGFHDSLTGLYNRAYFEEELKRLDSERQLPLSIIIGDVNGLKLVNDAFGHQEGDLLLCVFARIFEECCRREDLITRWGGDEFAILLPKMNEEDVSALISRIRKRCKEEKGYRVPLSISLGTATRYNANMPIKSLIKEAEDNMYKRKLIEKKSISSSIIASLEKTLSEKSFETEKHTKRLGELAIALGAAIDLPEKKLDELALLAPLHDIGKVAIPEKILAKKGKLTESDWKSIKSHPVIGYNIVESSSQLSHLSEGILYHHEWWDGSGYPQGLKGKQIPIVSRIIAIVDAYDVMINGRPYKKPMNIDNVIIELLRCSGSQFDSELVEIFMKRVLKYGKYIKGLQAVEIGA
jgi:diguanylate cyclase (GGDEF)-like protein/PAS domain S-box-containing protein